MSRITPDQKARQDAAASLEAAIEAECGPDPYVSKTEARETAAQLLGLELCFVKCSETDHYFWIRATVPGAEQYNFRGVTWFNALESVHRFLIDRVVELEKMKALDPPEEG